MVDTGGSDLSSHSSRQAQAALFPRPALPATPHGGDQEARIRLASATEVSGPSAMAGTECRAATMDHPRSQRHGPRGDERRVLRRISVGLGIWRKCQGNFVMTRTLTILISSHNRAGLLERTLRYLNEARPPGDWSIDVLVAANACTDGTHAFLDRYVLDTTGSATPSGRLRVRWVAEPKAGKSHALNCAVPLLNSEYVAFVDDDHRVDVTYLE